MKKIVEYATLHAPHFHLSGVNLGDKLDSRPKGRAGLTLQWDTDDKELLVIYAGRVEHVPETNVKSYALKDELPPPAIVKEVPKAVEPATPQAPDKAMGRPARATAQVSTPTQHVFAGPGAGDTGQAPPKAII